MRTLIILLVVISTVCAIKHNRICNVTCGDWNDCCHDTCVPVECINGYCTTSPCYTTAHYCTMNCQCCSGFCARMKNGHMYCA